MTLVLKFICVNKFKFSNLICLLWVDNNKNDAYFQNWQCDYKYSDFIRAIALRIV